jgi:hypothetical protein
MSECPSCRGQKGQYESTCCGKVIDVAGEQRCCNNFITVFIPCSFCMGKGEIYDRDTEHKTYVVPVDGEETT